MQSKVFDVIVRRFLSIFYPPAEYQTLKLVIGIEKESLFASAKVLKVLGYLEVLGKTLEDNEDDENSTNQKNRSGQTAQAGAMEADSAMMEVNAEKKTNAKKLLDWRIH